MSTATNEPGWHMRPPQQPYIEELLRENDRLRGQVTSLEEENEVQRTEKQQLERRFRASLETVARRKGQEDFLSLQLDDTIKRNRQLIDRCAVVEHKCIDFAHLLTASYRLQKAWDRSAVVVGLQEILVALVGCEELAIFECVGMGKDLVQLSALGRSPTLGVFPASGLLAEALERGEVVFAEGVEDSSLEVMPSVCIPLLVDEMTLGLVALYRLLPQKFEGLTKLDGELLDLLIWQGGRALHWATRNERAGASSLPKQETRP
jgi:hypothetical protein